MLSQIFEVSNWSSFLLQQLFTYYVNNEHCDLILMCNKQQFFVHRAVMSASSEYFRNIKKDTETIILPNEVSVTALAQLISFMYTGKLEINEKTKNEIISLLHLIKIPILLDMIKGTNETDCTEADHWNNFSIEEVPAKKSKFRGKSRKSILKLKKMNGLKDLYKFPVPRAFSNYDVYRNVRMEDITKPLRFEASNKAMFYYSNFDNISYESDPILKQVEAYNNYNNTNARAARGGILQDDDEDDYEDDDDNDNGADYKGLLSQQPDDECCAQKMMLIGHADDEDDDDDTAVVPYIFNNNAAIEKYDHHAEWDDNEPPTAIYCNDSNTTDCVDNGNDGQPLSNGLVQEETNNETVILQDDDVNMMDETLNSSANTNEAMMVTSENNIDGIEIIINDTVVVKNAELETSAELSTNNIATPLENDDETRVEKVHDFPVITNGFENTSNIDVSSNVKVNNNINEIFPMLIANAEKTSNCKVAEIGIISSSSIINSNVGKMTVANSIAIDNPANETQTPPDNKEIKHESKTIILNSSEIKGLTNHSDLIQTVIKKLPSLTANGKRIRFKIKSPAYLNNGLFQNSNAINNNNNKINDNNQNNNNNITTDNSNIINKKKKPPPSSSSKKPRKTGKTNINGIPNNNDNNNKTDATDDDVASEFVEVAYEDGIIKSSRSKLSVENVDGPWECFECGDNKSSSRDRRPLRLRTYRSYREHIRDVHNIRDNGQYCEYCGYRSYRKVAQYYHLYVNHNVKPPKSMYFPKCEECGYIANTKLAYEKHRRKHRSFKKYFCTCEQRFATEADLTEHAQTCPTIIAAKREYRCAICNISLDRMINLKAHIRINHKHLLPRLSQLEKIQQGVVEVHNNGIRVRISMPPPTATSV